MSKRIGWGIIGCGWIGTEAIAPAIQWSTNGRLVGVASRDRLLAAAKAREIGAERPYSPYEAMLADPEIDAVYIGLPNGLHEEWAIRCAEAGKHVLCDKSLTMTARSARRVAAAFESRGLRLVEGFMYRHHPQWAVVRRLLDEGAIGRPRIIRSTFCSRFDKPADHRWSRQLGGGALWDLTCYAVNAARYLTRSEPTRVCAVAEPTKIEDVDASSTASLELEGGVIAAATGSLQAGLEQSVIVNGEEGTLEVPRPFFPHWEPTQIIVRPRSDAERRYDVGGANHFLHQVEHFASLVLDPTKPLWPAETGVRNVTACEAIEKSWRAGGSAVAVEPSPA